MLPEGPQALKMKMSSIMVFKVSYLSQRDITICRTEHLARETDNLFGFAE